MHELKEFEEFLNSLPSSAKHSAILKKSATLATCVFRDKNAKRVCVQILVEICELGTGHKVFTRGCGGYFRGVRKKIRISKSHFGFQNISRRLPKPRGVRKKTNSYNYVEY